MNKNKELLLKYLCMSLPYGVKILHTGWDCDSGTDFDTVETLIGIDDKFIYTVWDKTGDREKHCLSVSNWKPYLRPMSSMTEEEAKEIAILHDIKDILSVKVTSDYIDIIVDDGFSSTETITLWYDELISSIECIYWLLEHHFDFMGLIPQGLAIEVTENNNPYKI